MSRLIGRDKREQACSLPLLLRRESRCYITYYREKKASPQLRLPLIKRPSIVCSDFYQMAVIEPDVSGIPFVAATDESDIQ
jgi:hypothetical protein